MLNNNSTIMIRHLIYFAMLAVTISSCGNNESKKVISKDGESAGTIKVAFDSLIAKPESFIGKTISLEGKVVHVCTETGKKMFITGNNPDFRLYVGAGDKISKFPMELLGSEITVEGVIVRAPGAENSDHPMKEGAMKEGAMKGMHDGESKAMAGDSCETEKALSGQMSLADIRMEYRSHTVR